MCSHAQKPIPHTQVETTDTMVEAEDNTMEVGAKQKRPTEPTETSVQTKRRSGARTRASQVDSDSDQEAPRSRSPVPKLEQAVTETEDKIKNSAS